MTYPLWHKKTVKKIGPISETSLYIQTLLFGLVIFGASYYYLSLIASRNILNKATADTAIVLIGLSMLLTSLCYFWDFVDTKIIYRKHLGLVGFGFGVIHILLSFSAFMSLFDSQIWIKGTYWPMFSGGIAMAIFAIMALISNRYAANVLGGYGWRIILRTGYVAVALVWVHVYLLKSARIVTWYLEGMKTPPSSGLIVLIFMTVVVVMRILLWLSLLKRNRRGL